MPRRTGNVLAVNCSPVEKLTHIKQIVNFAEPMIEAKNENVPVYTIGHIDYEIVKNKVFFKAGIQRLAKANTKQIPLAIMCSEGNPAHCHRSKLIAPALLQQNIKVQHINTEGVLQTQEEVMRETNKGQNGLLF